MPVEREQGAGQPARESGGRARPSLPVDEAALTGFSERQKDLLAAALEVFNRKGYEGSRTREIAQEAGVSEATLFKNFPTKRHLLTALLRPFIATVVKPLMLKPVFAVLEENEAAPLDVVLRAVMRERLALVRSRLPLFRTFLLEAVHQPDLLEAIRGEIVPAIAGAFTLLLDRVQARGEPVPADRRVFMRSALSLLVGYLAFSDLSAEHFGSEGDEKAVDAIVGTLLHGALGRREVQG